MCTFQTPIPPSILLSHTDMQAYLHVLIPVWEVVVWCVFSKTHQSWNGSHSNVLDLEQDTTAQTHIQLSLSVSLSLSHTHTHRILCLYLLKFLEVSSSMFTCNASVSELCDLATPLACRHYQFGKHHWSHDISNRGDLTPPIFCFRVCRGCLTAGKCCQLSQPAGLRTQGGGEGEKIRHKEGWRDIHTHTRRERK